MADILYTYKDSVYANITNKCNCSCTFCIRSLRNGVGSADNLWHEKNPTKDEVLNAIRNYDFSGYKELVFCGYGDILTAYVEETITSGGLFEIKRHKGNMLV